MKKFTRMRMTAALCLLLACIAAMIGYLVGQSNSMGLYQPTALTSPNIPLVSYKYTPTPMSQPTGALIIKSQSISPDGKTKILIRAPETIVYGSPQQILISDLSGTHETVVLSGRDFVGGGVPNDLTPANWSPDGKYVYVYMRIPLEAGDLYVFKASGKPFPNGKQYLLASKYGYPQMPLTATWVTNAQIQLIADDPASLASNRTVTYTFDVKKQTVTLK